MLTGVLTLSVYTLYVFTQQFVEVHNTMRIVLKKMLVEPWLKRFVADLLVWRSGFDPTPVHVRYLVRIASNSSIFLELFDL